MMTPMVNVINLTPHAVIFRPSVGQDVVVPPSGATARVSQAPAVVEGSVQTQYGPVTVFTPTTFGEVTGLPEPVEGTMFVVSLMVAQARPERRDLVVVAETIRADQGRIVAAQGVRRI